MEKTFTCINCPIGCQLTATVNENQVTHVEDAGCARGVVYAKQEAVNPTRMVTAVISIPDREEPLSVKTAAPIPKDKIFACMSAIKCAKVCTPIRIGDVVCRDVCGTGVDVVSTRDIL